MEYYPTVQHAKAAERLVEIFSKRKEVMSILLSCSCARGKATKDSCLDVDIIVKDKISIKKIKAQFKKACKKDLVFKDLAKVGKYSNIDLGVTDGKIVPGKHGWTSGSDDFELQIGNLFKYSVVLFDRAGYFKKLRKKYLPYYSESLRKKRLLEVRKFLNNNLDHVPWLVGRGLYFQAFKRLYDASREFLQVLFIKNKIYPIAYDKWVKEQLAEILGKPELYEEFVKLYEIKRLESNELAEKAKKLVELAEKYL